MKPLELSEPVSPAALRREFRARSLAALLVLSALLAPARSAFADVLATVDGKHQTVTVLRIADAGVVVQAADGEKTWKFDDLEAACAYSYLRRTVGDKDAKGHLRLGKYCLKRRLYDDAQAELARAETLDPALENEVTRTWIEGRDEGPRPLLTPQEVVAVEVEQRARAAGVAKAVARQVFTLETPHFIIHTTFPVGDHALFKELCEDVYQGFDRIFEISKTRDRMWDGKCVAYFFQNRTEFKTFAATVHHFPAEVAGGYFRARGGQCEVVIPNIDGLDRFKETLVHEGAHAFLHFYRATGHVPTWVQEGVAQYFEFDRFPDSRTVKMLKKEVLTEARSFGAVPLKNLAAEDRPTGPADIRGYAYAYSYVDFLIRAAPRRFADFVRGMKSGLEPEEALKKAYGWDFDAFQKNWTLAVSDSR